MPRKRTKAERLLAALTEANAIRFGGDAGRLPEWRRATAYLNALSDREAAEAAEQEREDVFNCITKPQPSPTRRTHGDRGP